MEVLRKSTGVPRRAGRSGGRLALRSHPQMTGTQFVAGNGTERRIKLKYYYRVTRDWKAEMNLRTPRLRFGLSGNKAVDDIFLCFLTGSREMDIEKANGR